MGTKCCNRGCDAEAEVVVEGRKLCESCGRMAQGHEPEVKGEG